MNCPQRYPPPKAFQHTHLNGNRLELFLKSERKNAIRKFSGVVTSYGYHRASLENIKEPLFFFSVLSLEKMVKVVL
jgi:hypothetical protein